MSKALYRTYRSKSLSEIVGQEHVTDILARSLKQGKIAHAYLLTGPKGVGKTSIARILAHEINHLPYTDESSHLDIIEIDAASNNGVEDIRDLREKVQLAPVSADKKVYIIDEVHMLSKAAFNALLKTLEEPPVHVVFILATTDSDKLPATIISRTQQFHFRTIGLDDLKKHLRFIADQEKIKIEDAALELIALRGDGSFRDSISLLDQLSSIADAKAGITGELVEQMLGMAPKQLVEALLAAYAAKDLARIVELLDQSEQQGIQTTVLVAQLIQTIRSQMIDKPQLIALLDQLLEVGKSSHPPIKLLSILAAHAAVKPKSAALSSPPGEVSASVEALRKKSESSEETSLSLDPTKENLTATLSTPPNDAFLKPSSASKHQQRVTVGGAAPENVFTKSEKFSGAENGIPAKPVSWGEGQPAGPASAESYVQKREQEAEPHQQEEQLVVQLDWNALIEHTRTHYVAVYSVLSKCSHELNGRTLTLYTGNKFYKKKLDDDKHRINLQKALQELGVEALDINTIGSPAPPKDGVAASVAAIMGGGEEVSVEA